MQKLPIGIVGVGHLGSLHAKMLASSKSVELVGIVDTNAARAESVAREFNTRVFATVADLLPCVKAVSVATPTSTHSEIASQAIERGVHVFIEKPITRTVAEAELLVKLAREKHVLLQVGHIERFNPALLALEHYRLDPMFVESHRLSPFNLRGTDVAVVLDLMIHDIDIILSLVNSPVERIEANGVAVVSDTIDIANARLQFANGCVANVTASRISQKKMRKMRLFQRDAYLSIDFLKGTTEVFRLVDGGDATATMLLGQIGSGKVKRTIVYEQPEVKDVNALQYELELFVDAVQNGKQPVVSGEDGMRALGVAHEILEKIKQQPVKL